MRQPESEPSEAGSTSTRWEMVTPAARTASSRRRSRICDMCGGDYAGDRRIDGCFSTCPRHAGWARAQIARALQDGRLVTGLYPGSRLLREARDDVRRRLGSTTSVVARATEAARQAEEEAEAARRNAETAAEILAEAEQVLRGLHAVAEQLGVRIPESESSV